MQVPATFGRLLSIRRTHRRRGTPVRSIGVGRPPAAPAARGSFDRTPRLVRPAVDLDGDGVRDLVFASQHQSSLLALSGKAGDVLWVSGPDSQEVERQADTKRRDE